MENVKSTKLLDQNLVNEIAFIRGNTGSLIGTLFEYYIHKELKNVNRYFVPQRNKYDKDIVCTYDQTLDIEIKTSSSRSNYIFGNRISPDSTHKDSYYILAVKYDITTLELIQIRFGWCDPSQWIQQKGNGQQSRLSLQSLQMCSI